MSEPEGAGRAQVEVSVVVDADHLASIDDVATALEGAGLRVGEVMGTLGVITGTAPDRSGLEALEALEGVESVEVARTFQLAPPDSDVQ